MLAREIGKRIVIKVGSALVTNNGKEIDREAIAEWCRQIAQLQKNGYQIIFVSSGAIACGMRALNLDKRPRLMSELQAAAAIGQMDLCQIYRGQFNENQQLSAQILLTHQDLADRQRYLNARATILKLVELGVVPIINENDTVVTDEIKFGDNDTLAALVANLVEADLLLILTDQRGLYTADPRKDSSAEFLSEVTAGDPHLETIAGSTTSQIAKGGMITKVLAAKRAAKSGAHTIVASGRETDVILKIIANGENIGSYFRCEEAKINARQQWLADHLLLAGTFYLDDGAVAALKSGRSLLAIGVTKVEGEFTRGSAIACVNSKRQEIARGLTNYSSSEARQILGIVSNEFEKILGYQNEDELIHRDNLYQI